MIGKTIIERWIAALAVGDVETAGTLLSPAFKIHDGMSREQYLRHELQEFKLRKEGFGISACPTVVETNEAPGTRHIIVLSSSGHLAYEDWLSTDEQGLISGNGRPIEVVTKMSFNERAARPHRAMAIRSHGAEILQVIPLFSVSQCEFTRCDTYADDRFNILSFDDDEPFLSGDRSFRAVTAIERMTFSALMRGMDHPYFVPDRFPQIDDRSVQIDIARGPVWSVTARMDNGRVETIDCPRNEWIEFPAAVVSATLTDAIDNDWTAYARRSS